MLRPFSVIANHTAIAVQCNYKGYCNRNIEATSHDVVRNLEPWFWIPARVCEGKEDLPEGEEADEDEEEGGGGKCRRQHCSTASGVRVEAASWWHWSRGSITLVGAQAASHLCYKMYILICL